MSTELSLYGDETGSFFMSANRKRLHLDLNACKPGAKKVKMNAAVLSSPDLNMLKLASPDLERFIIQQNGLVTTTPTPTGIASILFPRQATEEQENYARGFTDALNAIRQLEHQPGVPLDMVPPLTSPMCYTDLDSVKSEDNSCDNVETCPKRERNRIAASKCRQRKLEKISKLEDRVRQLKGENAELSGVVHKLRAHVCTLKEKILSHVKDGCTLMVAPDFLVKDEDSIIISSQA
ncbi:unnamed protein product, partial [Darwinula stevensoni]